MEQIFQITLSRRLTYIRRPNPTRTYNLIQIKFKNFFLFSKNFQVVGYLGKPKIQRISHTQLVRAETQKSAIRNAEIIKIPSSSRTKCGDLSSEKCGHGLPRFARNDVRIGNFLLPKPPTHPSNRPRASSYSRFNCAT